MEESSFPQRTSCGPIEGMVSTPTPDSVRSAFRNEQVAAPLKVAMRWVLLFIIYFPQRTSCGPIEGVPRSTGRSAAKTFPQRTSCGPIEGEATDVLYRILTCFPQRTSCGPIEGQGACSG